MDIINANGATAGSPGAAGGTGAAGTGSSAPGALGAGSPGAGQLRAATPFFQVTVNPVAPSDTAGMDVHTVMDILRNLDVEGVREAAGAHAALGETLDRIVENLEANGQTLAGSWRGDAAQTAVETFRQMHSQAAELSAQAKQTGQTLHWTASVMEQYRNLPTPLGEPASPASERSSVTLGDVVATVAGAASPGAGHQAKANVQAQKYLDELNQHLVTANNAMPSSIGHAAAPSSGSAHAVGTAAGAPGGAGHAVSGPSPSPYPGTRSGSGAAGPSGISGTPSAPVPHAATSAALQSSGVPAGGSATLTPAAATAPTGPSGSGIIPGMMPGPVAGTSSVPGGSLGNTTDDDETEGSESQLAAAEDTEAENSGAAIGDRRQNSGEGAGLPMMGAPGGGQPGQERQRQSWMNEDGNIWGVPQGTVGSEIGSH